MPFDFEPQSIPEVVLVTPKVFRDDRGFFLEAYKQSAFAAFGIDHRFVQDNRSRSKKGVLRGLHYQKPPAGQGKLVSVVSGEIFDVAVDLRQGAPTYGKWVGVMLSAENKRMLYIPQGFAHGFCVLSDWADVCYKATAEYSSPHDTGVAWNDPDLGVEWPIDKPLLSEKDAKLLRLRDAAPGFRYEEGGE